MSDDSLQERLNQERERKSNARSHDHWPNGLGRYPTYPDRNENPPAQFAITDPVNINYATMLNAGEGTLEAQLAPLPRTTTVRWHPDLKAFEVIIDNKSQMIHQEKIIDLVIHVAKENNLLKDAEKRVTELVKGLEEIRENVSSLIESCEEETCDKDNLCDKCTMIKSWVS